MHVDEPPTYQAAASAAERGLDNYIDSKQMYCFLSGRNLEGKHLLQ